MPKKTRRVKSLDKFSMPVNIYKTMRCFPFAISSAPHSRICLRRILKAGAIPRIQENDKRALLNLINKKLMVYRTSHRLLVNLYNLNPLDLLYSCGSK